ncbi:tripartite ATP-independent periplasmic transporter DctQ component [Citreicella sp. SE45]|uniref:TRAP transporter small permease n=1 Tax=Salipiger sp. HF18 TaxID=2721557 RepID=UPI0001B8C155|nr:TRAP transporter small permease [Salipiger sp. HF18]EEX12480.1 tripartite ATP-independent periplasmic transporter DctQ component [Citreicella sp. SE45]NIY94947.1 TRAP transporter small permease [Salipiger sp. HF18]NVK58701.1 TRAP transporter small permease [Paracoccaceae bacterium]
MLSLNSLRQGFETLLEVITAAIVAALTILIVCGTLFRYAGSPLVWYDEVASIGLVWMTYFGSALAALKGAHIGFPGVVNALPPNMRVAATVFSEACVFLFFGLMAYAGLEVLLILEGMTLVTLPAVSVQLTQSIIPLGAVLFMLAEAMRLPEVMRDARGSGFVDHEVREALAELEAEQDEGPAHKTHRAAHGEPRLGDAS